MKHDSEKQLVEINDIVLSFAQMDFTKRAPLKGESDRIDALAAGVNMLGEELQSSMISLKEKEILLKEIHHRVKNNLQIVSSILSLQAESIEDEISRDKILECKARIHSIALLHEKLHGSHNLKQIEINDYLLSLSRSVLKTIPSKNIDFLFTPLSEDYFTNVDELLPLGLILSELITNSVQHAYSASKSMELRISLRFNDDCSRLILMVSDNGKGAEINTKSPNTLGYKLIVALVEQLDALIDVHIESGTSVSISFLAIESPVLIG